MSSSQSPPVTVITVPSETTTTETPTTQPTTTSTTEVSEVVTTTITTVVTEVQPAETREVPGSGAAAVFFFAVLVLVAAGLFFSRLRRTRSEPVVVMPTNVSLTDRVRAAVERAESEEPAEYHDMSDVSVADLYPWIEPPDDLTLVVDLRTAEALQGVGVKSLDQLAHMDDDLVRSMIDAGIDIDTRAVEAAAQDILGRRTDGGRA